MAHDDFGGLHRDLPVLLDRRSALRWMGGVSLAGLLAACGLNGGSSSSSAAPSTSPPTPSTTALAALIGAEIPDETPGPFPADGSNGPNILTDDGPFKADLTTSFGALSGIAAGIPTDLRLIIVDNETGVALPGAVVYLWHCTADGRYSIYEVADQNYLRGAQAADDAGVVTFQTIFPGCYRGRWPHCHFEVFPSLAQATAGSAAIKTSQLAFPRADCEAVYADDRYGPSAGNLARLSLETDGVFRDGWADQLATVAGSLDSGYTATLLVRV